MSPECYQIDFHDSHHDSYHDSYHECFQIDRKFIRIIIKIVTTNVAILMTVILDKHHYISLFKERHDIRHERLWSGKGPEKILSDDALYWKSGDEGWRGGATFEKIF